MADNKNNSTTNRAEIGKTIGLIILKYWIPVILSAVVLTYLADYYSNKQLTNEKSRIRVQTKISTYKNTAKALTELLNNIELIISLNQRNAKPEEKENVEERLHSNEAELSLNFSEIRFLFGDKVVKSVMDYTAYITNNYDTLLKRKKRIEDGDQIKKLSKSILDAMSAEIKHELND